MTSLTLEDLRALLSLCNAGTPGPWQSIVEGRDHTSGSSFIRTSGNDIDFSGVTTADQDFIAAAKQAVPLLIQELAKAKGWSL